MVGDVVFALILGTFLTLTVELPFRAVFDLFTKETVSDESYGDRQKWQWMKIFILRDSK